MLEKLWSDIASNSSSSYGPGHPSQSENWHGSALELSISNVEAVHCTQQCFEELQLVEIDETLLTTHRHDEVVKICQRLETMDSVTKKLQDPSVSLWDARILFDALIDTFKDMNCLADKVDAYSPIMENPNLEVVIVKVQSGPEKRNVQHLLKPRGANATSLSNEDLSSADEWLRRGKQHAGALKSNYLGLAIYRPHL